MRMYENIVIFRDSMTQCGNNDRLKKSIEETIKNQKVILESDDIKLDADLYARYEEEASIRISGFRSMEAARQYTAIGRKVCVLNFANWFEPGGGVVLGCTAQEECLCRISTLYPCIAYQDCRDKFYNPHREVGNPMANNDLIYSPGITVFKSDTRHPEMMEEKDWFNVDVITAAAPDLRRCPHEIRTSEDFAMNMSITHYKRGARILDAAISQGADTIVLGAFGCGAFHNNPELVAKSYKALLPDYLHAFRTIEFAIYCGDPQKENYQVFKKVMGR